MEINSMQKRLGSSGIVISVGFHGRLPESERLKAIEVIFFSSFGAPLFKIIVLSGFYSSWGG